MIKQSAGLLLYRLKNKIPEFFLVHPGGPYWAKKEISAWSIPKGELGPTEHPLEAAIREMKEETGISLDIPVENFIPLSPVKQNPGKTIYAWALQSDIEPSPIRSNVFEMEWPPRSGKKKQFPEIDKADWFNFAEARKRIVIGQVPLLEEINQRLKKSY